jgi:hypothetical protein
MDQHIINQIESSMNNIQVDEKNIAKKRILLETQRYQ